MCQVLHLHQCLAMPALLWCAPTEGSEGFNFIAVHTVPKAINHKQKEYRDAILWWPSRTEANSA